MRITRFFTGEDNETHFEELEFPLAGAGGLNAAPRVGVDNVMFFDNNRAPGDPGTYHNAPQRQLVVMLSGVGRTSGWIAGDGSSIWMIVAPASTRARSSAARIGTKASAAATRVG